MQNTHYMYICDVWDGSAHHLDFYISSKGVSQFEDRAIFGEGHSITK